MWVYGLDWAGFRLSRQSFENSKADPLKIPVEQKADNSTYKRKPQVLHAPLASEMQTIQTI